jgi:MFS family permease
MLALFLLSRLNTGSPYWQAAGAMYVMGAGLGFTMQIIVTVVQNSVDRRHMGTATSAVTFFRSMGGAFGVAVMGAVLASRLRTHIADLFGGQPPQTGAGGSVTNNVRAIQQLPEPVHGRVVEAFSLTLHEMFLTVIPVVLIALIVSLFIREVPLRQRESSTDEAADDAEVAVAHP